MAVNTTTYNFVRFSSILGAASVLVLSLVSLVGSYQTDGLLRRMSDVINQAPSPALIALTMFVVLVNVAWLRRQR